MSWSSFRFVSFTQQSVKISFSLLCSLNKGAKRVPALTVSLMLAGHLASAQAHKPRLSPVLCAFALCLNRQRAKRYFTNSSNVGQVGSSGDAEQGERWHQAGYGCNWKSAEMVRESVYCSRRAQTACGGGDTTRNNEMKGKRAFIPLRFHSDVLFLRLFARLLFLSAF